MRAVDIIIKKREGEELTKDEIDFFVNGFTKGDIPDYQVAAWAMAIVLNGMTPEETTALTMVMVASGDQQDLSQIVPVAVDKHSTGGVGDKTTLVVGPVVAACGLPVGKMSGRGLGFSGGTLDKMESIPGFRCDLTPSEFLSQLKKIGIVLTGQTAKLAPADGKLYALRDVTGTVPSIPLIASSIMSKKIAAGAQAIVLDVKVGLGAFMKTLEEAQQLARMMVEIAALSDRKAIALISDMNQPLGSAVGNALEVREAVETLQGGGPDDFWQHSLEVAAAMLVLGKIASSKDDALRMASNARTDGRALEKFRQMVAAQGGDLNVIDHLDQLPRAQLIESMTAPRDGYIGQVHARIIGEAAVTLGAGRLKKGDSIDHSVGIEVHAKVGDFVNKGDKLFTIHANSAGALAQVQADLQDAYFIQKTPQNALPLFYETIVDYSADDVAVFTN